MFGPMADAWKQVSSGTTNANTRAGGGKPAPDGAADPGKKPLTRLLPGSKTTDPAQPDGAKQALEGTDLNFVQEGFVCTNNPRFTGCLWGGDQDGDAKRQRLLFLVISYAYPFFDDMGAAVEELYLDTRLAEPPKSLLTTALVAAIDFASGSAISKLGKALGDLKQAGKVAEGIREVTDQAPEALATAMAGLPAKEIEQVAKSVTAAGRRTAEGEIKEFLAEDWEAKRERKVALLSKIRATFRAMAHAIVEMFSSATDQELVALVQLLKHGPSIAELKEIFKSIVDRHEEQVAPIGTKYKAGGRFHLAKVTMYNQSILLLVAQDGTGKLFKYRGEDYHDDGQAHLVAIVDEDMKEMAIEQNTKKNGGPPEEFVMDWKSYQNGASPFPSLSLNGDNAWSLSSKGRFHKWAVNAYKSANGGKNPPEPDPFGLHGMVKQQQDEIVRYVTSVVANDDQKSASDTDEGKPAPASDNWWADPLSMMTGGVK